MRPTSSRGPTGTLRLPVAVTRFANLYGGGDLNPSRLIPEAVAAALAGRAPVIRSDGTPRARLPLRRGRRRRLPGDRRRAARGGARRGVQRRRRAAPQRARGRRAGLRVGGHRRRARHPRGRDAARRDRPPVRRLDQAARATGWQPQVDLEEGLRRTVEWYRAHPEALAPEAARALGRRAVARPPAAAALAAQRAGGADARRAALRGGRRPRQRRPETEELLRTHPLAAAGRCATCASTPGPGRRPSATPPGGGARRRCVAFTDDDCRPPADWLERALAAARRAPRRGRPGRDAARPRRGRARCAAARTRAPSSIDPPTPWAQTCNIVYPRELLERARRLRRGAPGRRPARTPISPQRARRSARRTSAAPEVVTWHAVEAGRCPRGLRRLPGAGATWPRWSSATRACASRCRWGSSGSAATRWLPLALVGARWRARRPLLALALRAAVGAGRRCRPTARSAARAPARARRAARAAARSTRPRWPRVAAGAVATARCCCEGRAAQPVLLAGGPARHRALRPRARRRADRARPRAAADHEPPGAPHATVEDGLEVVRALAPAARAACAAGCYEPYLTHVPLRLPRPAARRRRRRPRALPDRRARRPRAGGADTGKPAVFSLHGHSRPRGARGDRRGRLRADPAGGATARAATVVLSADRARRLRALARRRGARDPARRRPRRVHPGPGGARAGADDLLRRRRERAAQARRLLRRGLRAACAASARTRGWSSRGRADGRRGRRASSCATSTTARRSPRLPRGVGRRRCRRAARRSAWCWSRRWRAARRSSAPTARRSRRSSTRAAVGRLFDGDDPSALARALLEALELARDPQTAAACRARAEEFSWERTTEAYLGLYEEVAAWRS